MTTLFPPALAARFDKLVTLYPMKRSALVPMLLYAQDEVGYLSDPVIAEIAERVGATELEVRNVISYYSMLRTKPAGKYHVQVCTNISCMLRGGNEILDHCKKKLGIPNKGVTADGLFSLEEVECIGACSWAPAAQVNYDFHENLTPDSIDQVLADYRANRKRERRIMATLSTHPDCVPVVSYRFGKGATNIDNTSSSTATSPPAKLSPSAPTASSPR